MALNTYLIFVDANEKIVFYGRDDPGTPDAGETKITDPPLAPVEADMWNTGGGTTRTATQAEKDAGLAFMFDLSGNEPVAKSAAFTAVAADATYLCTIGSNYAATLPAPADGLRIAFISINQTVGNIMTITPNGGNIDNASTLVFYVTGDRATLVADGTNWWTESGYLVPHSAKISIASTAQTVATSALEVVEFDTIVDDNVSMADVDPVTAANITVKRAGKYRITWSAHVEDLDSGFFIDTNVRVGATNQRTGRGLSRGANSDLRYSDTITPILAAGAVVDCTIYQNNGTTLSTSLALEVRPYLEVIEER